MVFHDADSVDLMLATYSPPVSPNMAGNLKQNGEFPIAIFDYWRGLATDLWDCGLEPLAASRGIWLSCAGHGRPFLSTTLAKNSNIGKVVNPSSASDEPTSSVLIFLAEYLHILMGSFAKGSHAPEFH